MYGIVKDSNIIARFTAPVTVRSNQAVSSSDSLSLKRFALNRGGQRWEIVSGLEPLVGDANELMAHVVINGSYLPFDVSFPQNYGVVLKRKKATTTPTAFGLSGSTELVLGNFADGTIPIGCFVKFTNHSKIYMVTETLSGNGSLKIFPALRADVSNLEMKYMDDVIAKMLYDTDVVKGMVYRDGILQDMGTITLIEQL